MVWVQHEAKIGKVGKKVRNKKKWDKLAQNLSNGFRLAIQYDESFDWRLIYTYTGTLETADSICSFLSNSGVYVLNFEGKQIRFRMGR